jgi:hypothetical protein
LLVGFIGMNWRRESNLSSSAISDPQDLTCFTRNGHLVKGRRHGGSLDDHRADDEAG